MHLVQAEKAASLCHREPRGRAGRGDLRTNSDRHGCTVDASRTGTDRSLAPVPTLAVLVQAQAVQAMTPSYGTAHL